MDGFWAFAGNFWWLIFVLGGPIAAVIGTVSKNANKASERRAKMRLERYRIKHGAQTAAQQVEADAVTSRETFVAATRRLVEEHDETSQRWFAYETDPVKLLEYPLMTDMREDATVAFHRAKRTADSLRPDDAEQVTDRTTQREYREAVHAYAAAFDVAEAEARRVRQSGFSTDERDSLARALRMLRLALDDAASPGERQSAYKRVQKEIDGLIVLPQATTDAVERRIAGHLPASPSSPTPAPWQRTAAQPSPEPRS